MRLYSAFWLQGGRLTMLALWAAKDAQLAPVAPVAPVAAPNATPHGGGCVTGDVTPVAPDRVDPAELERWARVSAAEHIRLCQAQGFSPPAHLVRQPKDAVAACRERQQRDRGVPVEKC